MDFRIKNTNISINVKDLDKSVKFYESLGLVVKQRWGNHYAQLTGPNIIIGLHPTAESKLSVNTGNISIGFTTDDFEGTRSALTASGIEVHERKEEGGEFLHFKDPDGSSLYFINPNW